MLGVKAVKLSYSCNASGELKVGVILTHAYCFHEGAERGFVHRNAVSW